MKSTGSSVAGLVGFTRELFLLGKKTTTRSHQITRAKKRFQAWRYQLIANVYQRISWRRNVKRWAEKLCFAFPNSFSTKPEGNEKTEMRQFLSLRDGKLFWSRFTSDWIWSNCSDLTRPKKPNFGSFLEGKWDPLFQGVSKVGDFYCLIWSRIFHWMAKLGPRGWARHVVSS